MARGKSKVTIYDVADHAGVAISTVSRVLNNSRDVSERTRARVLESIEALKFRPDRVAKILSSDQGLTGPSALVPIQRAGSRSPMFFIHSSSGHILFYAHLAVLWARSNRFTGYRRN